MKYFQTLLILVFVSSCLFNKTDPKITSKNYAIYDDDNRVFIIDGISEENSQIKKNSKAVAAMVRKRILRSDEDSNFYTFKKTTVANQYGLCSDQSFAQNNALANCTGFLIAGDLLVTAGHCITSARDCENFSWVFDYQANSDSFKKENVYNCKEIVFRKVKQDREEFVDLAVIKLDKPTNRKNLKLRTYGRLSEQTPVYIIGHPLGMGLTLAESAKTYPMDRKVLLPESSEQNDLDFFNAQIIHQDKLFITDIDGFAGNSGSPVFNARTHTVEGIFLGGANDFKDRVNDHFICGENNKIDTLSGKIQEHILRVRDIAQLQELIKTSN